MICPCNVAFISFVLQQTVMARKYVCIRTPLELGEVQKVEKKKKFRKCLFLSDFRNFFGAPDESKSEPVSKSKPSEAGSIW